LLRVQAVSAFLAIIAARAEVEAIESLGKRMKMGGLGEIHARRYRTTCVDIQ